MAPLPVVQEKQSPDGKEEEGQEGEEDGREELEEDEERQRHRQQEEDEDDDDEEERPKPKSKSKSSGKGGASGKTGANPPPKKRPGFCVLCGVKESFQWRAGPFFELGADNVSFCGSCGQKVGVRCGSRRAGASCPPVCRNPLLAA